MSIRNSPTPVHAFRLIASERLLCGEQYDKGDRPRQLLLAEQAQGVHCENRRFNLLAVVVVLTVIYIVTGSARRIPLRRRRNNCLDDVLIKNSQGKRSTHQNGRCFRIHALRLRYQFCNRRFSIC